ncbi:MAG: hypothetical protein ABIZ56_09690 [Chthoniobacteraceae bacterium]
MGVAPFHELPLVAPAVLLPEGFDQFQFRFREVLPFRFLLQLDFVVHPVADAPLPSRIHFSLQPAGVNEVEHFTRHRAVAHGEIIAAYDGDASAVERQPVEQVDELHQLHDAELSPGALQRLADRLGGFANLEAEVHVAGK